MDVVLYIVISSVWVSHHWHTSVTDNADEVWSVLIPALSQYTMPSQSWVVVSMKVN